MAAAAAALSLRIPTLPNIIFLPNIRRDLNIQPPSQANDLLDSKSTLTNSIFILKPYGDR